MLQVWKADDEQDSGKEVCLPALRLKDFLQTKDANSEDKGDLIMGDNADAGEKVQELQQIEQNAQALLMQKQTLQVEVNEIQNALAEIQQSTGEVYRILGGIMLRSTKEHLTKELTEKKKVIDLRIQAIEKQEAILDGKSRKLRDDFASLIQNKKSK